MGNSLEPVSSGFSSSPLSLPCNLNFESLLTYTHSRANLKFPKPFGIEEKIEWRRVDYGETRGKRRIERDRYQGGSGGLGR